MMTANRFFVTSVLAAALALPVHAYNDQVTHPQLTFFATEKSVLYTDASIMFKLGLLPANKQFFNYRGRVGSLYMGTATYSLAQFIGEGSYDEDLGDKSLNHFYDPVFDRTLTVLLVPFGRRSWEWMLESAGHI